MIFITGDTHGWKDLDKLKKFNFKTQDELTKEDYVIILGDFGLLWNNSEEERYWLDWLDSRNFTTLFVDGNHENFNLLYEYKLEEWNGGLVRYVKPTVLHLSRGQIFTIDDLKFFIMGGASSIDKHYRTPNISWWKEELPTDKEIITALANLDNNNNNKVDYILTHTCSNRLVDKMGFKSDRDKLNNLFDLVENKIKYRHWYFGHFHKDFTFNDNKHTVLYNTVLQIN